MMNQHKQENIFPRPAATGLIFIVDDHPENIRVLGNILRQKGYKLAIASNGPQALGMIKQKPPDLLLLDVMMPEMDGYQVCEKIKNDPITENIPVIFLTAKSELEDKIKGFQVGGVDYITKPFESSERLARVATQIQLKKAMDFIRHQNDRLELMLEERTRELVKSERQAAFAQFMQGIIHNLRSPISVVQLTASLIQSQKADTDILLQENVCNIDFFKRIFTEIWDGMGTILEASDDLNSMIKSMMIKSRDDKMASVVRKDLNDIVLKELEFLDADLELKHKIRKDIQLSNEALPVDVVPGEISQVVQNLIQNAKDAVMIEDKDREITISTGKQDDLVYLKISDTGVGIPGDDVARIFEPFYTTKGEIEKSNSAVPTGTGLGLFICQKIIQTYNGKIEVNSELNKGTTFSVLLPAS